MIGQSIVIRCPVEDKPDRPTDRGGNCRESIEILSPSTAFNDQGVKFEVYEKDGVREYWPVDPEAKVTEVYRHDGSRFARSGVFKGGQPLVSAALAGAAINTEMGFAARKGAKDD